MGCRGIHSLGKVCREPCHTRPWFCLPELMVIRIGCVPKTQWSRDKGLPKYSGSDLEGEPGGLRKVAKQMG